MGKLNMSGIVNLLTAPSIVPVSTTWLYEYGQDGIFEVPESGTYQVEIHGGGGGGVYRTKSNASIGGGGSGEMFVLVLTKGEKIPVTIGAGGAGKGETSDETVSGESGEASSFGSYATCAGGVGGKALHVLATPGGASGGLASAGTEEGVGGLGNVNKPDQTYGNGGSANYSQNLAEDGQPGAIIITSVGV